MNSKNFAGELSHYPLAEKYLKNFSINNNSSSTPNSEYSGQVEKKQTVDKPSSNRILTTISENEFSLGHNESTSLNRSTSSASGLEDSGIDTYLKN